MAPPKTVKLAGVEIGAICTCPRPRGHEADVWRLTVL